MKRQLMFGAACILLVGGWFSAFLATGVVGRTPSYMLGPALLLGGGMGLLLKLANIRLTAITLALTAMLALVLLEYIFPQHFPRLANLQTLKPQAYSSPLQVRPADQVGLFAEERHFESSAELEIQLFALLPGVVRNMIYRNAGESGQLFVSLPELGAIYLLTDSDNDGYADVPVLFHAGMDRPFGMAWVDGRLYVAEPSRVLELKIGDSDLQVDQERVIVSDLPDDGGHWQRALVADPQGALYLSIGSRCNACEEEDQRRGTILKINPLEGTVTEFARGLRNTVGLAFAPDDATLWGADNSREMDGGRPPPDEINRIVEGGDYGWPYCFGKRLPDPQLGSAQRCERTLPSMVELAPGSNPLGIAFGAYLNAPQSDQESLYLVSSGFSKVLQVPYRQGHLSTPTDFLRGRHSDGETWLHPLAMTTSGDGFMYLSDERTRAIYRIAWSSGER